MYSFSLANRVVDDPAIGVEVLLLKIWVDLLGKDETANYLDLKRSRQDLRVGGGILTVKSVGLCEEGTTEQKERRTTRVWVDGMRS